MSGFQCFVAEEEEPAGAARAAESSLERDGMALLESFARERLESVKRWLGTRETKRATLESLERLAPDATNKPALLGWLRRQIAENSRGFEIRSALRACAKALEPRNYLEIGTRRGWSLVQVLGEAPHCQSFCVDLWVEHYASEQNPGPDFVIPQIQLACPGVDGDIHFLSGNSHDILPTLLGDRPPAPGEGAGRALARLSEERPHRFDLVCIDGDHTALGAWWDFEDVMPHVAVGGAVVFDDILERADELDGARAQCSFSRTDPGLEPSLREVWRRVQKRWTNFAFVEDLESIVPAGVALRLH